MKIYEHKENPLIKIFVLDTDRKTFELTINIQTKEVIAVYTTRNNKSWQISSFNDLPIETQFEVSKKVIDLANENKHHIS